MTTAITALAFTIVLAEMFAAVGLATLVPATFVMMCRAARQIFLTNDANQIDAVLTQLMKVAPPLPGLPALPTDAAGQAGYEAAAKPYKEALRKLIVSSDSLQLLAPKAATIDADFSCGGSESYGVTAGIEGVIQVIGIKAGYSQMFELHSSTTLRLHVEFGPVEYSLA